MTMDIIMYNLDVLQTCSNKMNTIESASEDICDNMKHMIDNIDTHWQSPAGRAYIERTKELYENLTKIIQEIDKDRSKLNTAIDIYKAANNINNNIVNTLSDRNIF